MPSVRFCAAGLIALVAGVSSPASAAPFKCPVTGGDLLFAAETKIGDLDVQTVLTASTRNIAMNIYESLMARDENLAPTTELAESVVESPDKLTYTFKLRQGIKFHNGKAMTTDDVVASYDRYKKYGVNRAVFNNVAGWEAPDKFTFIIRMKRPQGTFLQEMSAYAPPIVIMPAEQRDTPPQRIEPIGTGPFKVEENVPGSHVKLRRFADYKPNEKFENIDGYSGYKVPCVETVTLRSVVEPGARVAGLETGEFAGVEDIPATAVAKLKTNKNVTLMPLDYWWINMIVPNLAKPPTDNLAFRKAVQAALDMDEIMDAATDGSYRLNVGFQYPAQEEYTDAGKETYNVKNPELAKKYLKEANYKGEPVVVLTNKDYTSMFKSALVMAEQMKAVGINVRFEVLDWPTMMSRRENQNDWNLFSNAIGSSLGLGAVQTMKLFAPPVSMYHPNNMPQLDDPEAGAAYKKMQDALTLEERKAAFAQLQKLMLERVLVLPLGTLTKIQAVRSNLKGFKPYRTLRFSNIWLEK